MVFVVERSLPGLCPRISSATRAVRALAGGPDRVGSDRSTRKENDMNVSTAIPQTVQIRRGPLLGLIAGSAALAAATTWAILTLVGNTDDGQVQASPAAPSVATSSLSPDQSRYVKGISSLTPLERAAAFGGPAGALDALQLGPKARRYV